MKLPRNPAAFAPTLLEARALEDRVARKRRRHRPLPDDFRPLRPAHEGYEYEESNLLQDGVPTALARKLYTEGDCWALAWDLAKLSGGELVFVQPVKGPPDAWAHVVVALPGGLYMDVEGLHSADHLLARWNARQLTALRDLAPGLPATFHAYEDYVGGWIFGPAPTSTRQLAHWLLDTHYFAMAAD